LVWAFGGAIRATGLQVRIGQSCDIVDPADGSRIPAEVIGFSEGAAVLTPLKPLHGLSIEAEIVPGPDHTVVRWGEGLLGRIIDGRGAAQDGLGPVSGPFQPQAVYAQAPMAFERTPIKAIFPTGVRVIDSLLTLGAGQRVGVFATAGGGKSTLLGMIARRCESDVNVIALIGERGREVREFIDQALGPEGLSRSVVVVSTSDRPAMERVRAANAATAIAEGFRAQGKRVVLMMDSVTRFARALREIGLSMGEPPVRRGYPPSVFAELPRLFERAGSVGKGSITGIYTVLLEEQEEGADPVGEEVRSILDGHVYLSRKLGEAGRYPAVDVSASVSRLFSQLASPEHQAAANRVRSWISKHSEVEFLLRIGEYKPGGDELVDLAISKLPDIENFIRQSPDAISNLDQTLDRLRVLAS
jgi:type III secretion protein N (ATPase)